jgi:hypothetical protein
LNLFETKITQNAIVVFVTLDGSYVGEMKLFQIGDATHLKNGNRVQLISLARHRMITGTPTLMKAQMEKSKIYLKIWLWLHQIELLLIV